jgi:hypothetical protein
LTYFTALLLLCQFCRLLFTSIASLPTLCKIKLHSFEL